MRMQLRQRTHRFPILLSQLVLCSSCVPGPADHAHKPTGGVFGNEQRAERILEIIGRKETEARSAPQHAFEEVDTVGMPVFVSPNLTQFVDFDESAQITIVTREKRPGFGIEEHTCQFGTRDAVRTVCSRAPYELYVAMRDALTSEWVIESWKFSLPLGSRTILRPSTTAPIGQPVAYQAPQQMIVGGTYVPVAQRSGPPIPYIEQKYRGSDFVDITNFEIDPDCRYFLVISRPEQRLYQLPTGGGPPSVIGDTSNIPMLAIATQFRIKHHTTEGRFCILGALWEGLRTVIRDGNNDGLFETATIYFPDDFESAGYSSGWQDDFLSGWL